MEDEMQARPRADQIEREIQRQTQQSVAVEMNDKGFRLVGIVESPEALQAVLDVVRSLAPGAQLVNDMDVMQQLVEMDDPADLFCEPPSLDAYHSFCDTDIT